MLAPDGSELAFVATFGFAISLWTRRVFIAPALFLIVHYAVMVPVFCQAAIKFKVASAVTVWLSSGAGVCLNRLVRAPKLISPFYTERKMSVVNSFALGVVVLIPWVFIVARVFVPVTWSGAPAIAGTMLAYIVAWRLWLRGFMYQFFPCPKDTHVFATAGCAVQVVTLALLWAADVIFLDRDDNATVGFALRAVAVCTVSLVLIVARGVTKFSSRTNRRAEYSPPPVSDNYFSNILGESLSNSSTSSEGRLSDDDYVEYEGVN